MKNSIQILKKIILTISLSTLISLPTFATDLSKLPQAEERNDGQDPTKPLTRFDLRLQHSHNSEIPGGDDPDITTLIARIDKPIPLKSGWVYYLRTDMPFVVNDVPSEDNRKRNDTFGTGDFFSQHIMITPRSMKLPFGIQAAGIGSQLIIPTASKDNFGTGKWTATPLIAWKWGIGERTSLIPIFKYRFELGGDSDRNRVQEFQWKPQTNIKLDNDWFITLYDTADWVLQHSNDSKDDNEWFIPIDFMVGKTSSKCPFNLANRCVYSVNAIVPIVDDFERDEWTIQTRIGFFF